MTNPKLAELVRRVHERTMAGKLAWEESSSRNVFQISFPKYTVQTSYQSGREGSIDYLIRILNEENVVIEQATDVDLENDLGDTGVSYKLMEELYLTARRIAMGVDQALDTLLESLGDDPKPVPPKTLVLQRDR